MTNIFKRLTDAIKDEPNEFLLNRATGVFSDCTKAPDTYDPRKHNWIAGKSRELTRHHPIVVVIVKEDSDE